jgi:hypothetical protein
MAACAAARAALPPGWGEVEVGSPAIAGSALYSNGLWTVAGGGRDIWDAGDQFHFVTNSLTGDGSFFVRLARQAGTESWTQAGIMLRGTLSSNSPQVCLMQTPGNGISFRYRYTAGGATYQVNQSGIAAPQYLRLSRSSNTFVASYSTTGIAWTQLGSPQTVALPAQAIAGLAVTAHNNALLSTGWFSSPLIVPGAQAGTQTNLLNPYIGGLEMAWQTTWPLPQLDVASNAPTPRMGWNCYFVTGVSSPGPIDSIFRETADALVTSGLAAAGYRYEVIDGSWIATGRGYRDADGNLVVTNTYWPYGMKAVADYVHSRGLFMGGYSDIGSPGYGGSAAQIGMYGYYQQDANQFAAWGWDFIKIDDHGPGDFYAACHAIRNNTSNRPMVLSLSTPQVDGVRFAPRIANSYRVANDISFTMGTVSWSSILMEFDAAQARWYAQAPGHWNDPDMVCTGLNGISDVEGRANLNLWCILGAPLMIGTDVRRSGAKYYAPLLTDATLATLTNAEVIAIDQDALGAPGRPVGGGTAVYAKPLGSFTSGKYAVMVLNRSAFSNSFTVNWGDLGLKYGSVAAVRDLWQHQDLGARTNSFTTPILASHESMMLMVTGIYDWDRARTYEAESAYNTLSGAAFSLPGDSSFSSAAYVTGVGNGPSNQCQFNQVSVPSNGLYRLDIRYACDTALSAQLSINDEAATGLSFPATGSGTSAPAILSACIQLKAGANTLRFSSPSGPAPNLDSITISRGAPSALAATGGDAVIQLTWPAVSGATSYSIYRGFSSGGQPATPLAAGLTATNYADQSVTNGATYYYTVTAVNPALGGESTPSVEASACPRYLTSSLAYPKAVLAASPVAYWRLNETQGAVAYDATGSFNAAYGSNVALGNSGPRPADFLGFELTNTAARLSNNLTNSWITIPALNLNTNTVTLVAWIYPQGSQANAAGVLFYRTGATVAGLNYGDANSGIAGLLGYTWNDQQNTWSWNSGLTPPSDQWSMVALAVEPAKATLYLFTPSGVAAATNTASHPAQAFGGSGVIGTDPYAWTARVFNGLVDETAVFNRTLSPEQLRSLFESGSRLPRMSLQYQRQEGRLNLSWPQGTLLQATQLTGPWSRAAAMASPAAMTPTNGQTFYRAVFR